VNIEAHWFKRRTGVWSVRFDWTAPDGNPRQRIVHTIREDLLDAHGTVEVHLALADITGVSVVVDDPLAGLRIEIRPQPPTKRRSLIRELKEALEKKKTPPDGPA